MTNSHVFNFKISGEELRDIFINHLIQNGCIRENERELYQGFQSKGSAILVEFVAPGIKKED